MSIIIFNIRFIFISILLFMIFMIILCPFSTSTCFGKTTLLPLNQCIKQAIENDPEVTKVRRKIDMGDIKTREAIYRFFPTLSADTSYAPKLDFFGRPITDENIYRSTISVEQPLYKGGALTTTYKLTKSETLQNVYQYQIKAQEIGYNTTEEFYNSLSGKETLRLNEELHLKSEKLLSIARQAYEMKLATRVDFLEAEKNFYETKYKKLKAEQEYQLALMKLKKVMGIDPKEDIEPWEEHPMRPIGNTLEELNDEASRRIDIRYNEENVTFNQLKVKLNKSKRYPALSLVGGYDAEGAKFPGERRGWNVMAQFTISLFNNTLSVSSGRDYLYENPNSFIRQNDNFDVVTGKLSVNDGSSNAVSLEEARIEKKLAEDKLAQSKRDVAFDVKEAYYKLKQTESFMETTKKAMETAEEKLRVVSFKHGLGESTYKDLIEAQVDLTEAKVNHAKTVFDRSVAFAGLYKAIGKDIQWD